MGGSEGLVAVVSRGVPTEVVNRLHERHGAAGRAPRVAVVANAMDFAGSAVRRRAYQQKAEQLRAVGLEPRQVDLTAFDVRRTSAEGVVADLRRLLGYADCLWVGGGNTFTLLHLMRSSGLDRLLPELVGQGLSYVGASAGAVALADGLDGVDLVDPPHRVPRWLPPLLPGAATPNAQRVGAEAEGMVRRRGLGLLPFLPWPHWDPDAPAGDPAAGPPGTHQGASQVASEGEDLELRRRSPGPSGAAVWRLRDGEHLVLTSPGSPDPTGTSTQRFSVWEAEPVLVRDADPWTGTSSGAQPDWVTEPLF